MAGDLKVQTGEQQVQLVSLPRIRQSIYIPFDSKCLQNVESLKLSELKNVLANRPPGWQPRWLSPFEHLDLLRRSIKLGEVKNSFSDTPNDSEFKLLLPNRNELDKLHVNAKNGG